MPVLLPSRRQWETWSLPSKLTAISCYVTIVGALLTLVLYFLPASPTPSVTALTHNSIVSPRPQIDVYCSFFRTRLLDSIIGERALLIEVTEDLRGGCLDEPIVAWVKPFAKTKIRLKDDVGVRFIIKNVGDSPANALRISVDPWHALARAHVITSANIQAAVLSQGTSRAYTFDVITVPRIPPHTTAVITYGVPLSAKQRREGNDYSLPVRVLSTDEGAAVKVFSVTTAWADAAEAAVTGLPVHYGISMTTPVSFEDLHGDEARALVPIKLPPCKTASPPSTAP
jgi:hypothetical protein